MKDNTSCPECGEVARVEWRCVLESTDGPIEHGKVRCGQVHWFLLPVSMLSRGLAGPDAAQHPRRSRHSRTSQPDAAARPMLILLLCSAFNGLSQRAWVELRQAGHQVQVQLHLWVQRFTPLLIDAARPCRHLTGDRWFVDESYLKVTASLAVHGDPSGVIADRATALRT